MSFSDPIDGTNAGPRNSTGSTGGTTGGNAGDPGTSGSGLSGSTGTGGTTGGAGTPDPGLSGPSGTSGTGEFGASPTATPSAGTSRDAGAAWSTGAGTDGSADWGPGAGTSGRSTGTGTTDNTGADGFSGSSGLGTTGSPSGLGDGSPGLGSTAGTGEVGGVGEDFDLHEAGYRRHYTTVGTETAGGTGTYDEARTGYIAGHAAASNPAYADRTYEEVEVELERDVGTERFGRVREFARHAFEWKRVLAGVALVAGGYWASKKLFSAASELSEEDERDCRTFYDTHVVRSTGVPYSQARTVYVLGYVAGRNPDYSGRGYDEVEPHLRGGFSGRRAGSYDALRDFGRRGYERSSVGGTSGTGGFGAGTTGGPGGTGGLGGTTDPGTTGGIV